MEDFASKSAVLKSGGPENVRFAGVCVHFVFSGLGNGDVADDCTDTHCGVGGDVADDCTDTHCGVGGDVADDCTDTRCGVGGDVADDWTDTHCGVGGDVADNCTDTHCGVGADGFFLAGGGLGKCSTFNSPTALFFFFFFL